MGWGYLPRSGRSSMYWLAALLALSLRQPALPAQLYRTILTFLAGAPSAEEIAAFAPPSEAQQRLQALLDAERGRSRRSSGRSWTNWNGSST